MDGPIFVSTNIFISMIRLLQGKFASVYLTLTPQGKKGTISCQTCIQSKKTWLLLSTWGSKVGDCHDKGQLNIE